jgi:hypothetical protein
MPQPRGPGDRARDAEVLQAAGDEAEHLVAPAGRLDPELAGADEVVQLAGVPGEPEEPVLLLHRLRRQAVLGAVAVVQFGRGVELLAPHAVQAAVVAPVQVAAGLAPAPQPLHARPVPRVGAGADEIVEAERQLPAQRGERTGVAVHQLPGADALRLGGQHVRQGVVVGAALQPDLGTDAAMVPGQHIGLHQLERVPEVSTPVHVRDGGAEVDPAALRGGGKSSAGGHRNLLKKGQGHRPAHESRPRRGPHADCVLAC